MNHAEAAELRSPGHVHGPAVPLDEGRVGCSGKGPNPAGKEPQPPSGKGPSKLPSEGLSSPLSTPQRAEISSARQAKPTWPSPASHLFKARKPRELSPALFCFKCVFHRGVFNSSKWFDQMSIFKPSQLTASGRCPQAITPQLKTRFH